MPAGSRIDTETSRKSSGKVVSQVIEKNKEDAMTVDRFLRLIAGSIVLATILLSVYHSPKWLYFTGFVALNLMQSAFTNWCPMMTFLRKLGVKDQPA
jgi:hypothetical protein